MVPNDSGYNFVVMAFLSTSLIAVVNGQKKYFRGVVRIFKLQWECRAPPKVVVCMKLC
jgi:hypothetical protein